MISHYTVLTIDNDTEGTCCLGTRVSCECVGDFSGLTNRKERAWLTVTENIGDWLIKAISCSRFLPGDRGKCSTRLSVGSHRLSWAIEDIYLLLLSLCGVINITDSFQWEEWKGQFHNHTMR